MSEILEYKCPNCGGSMEFDSGTQKMKCPFCDSEFDVAALQQKDAVLDEQQPDHFEWNRDQVQVWGAEQNDMSVSSAVPAAARSSATTRRPPRFVPTAAIRS